MDRCIYLEECRKELLMNCRVDNGTPCRKSRTRAARPHAPLGQVDFFVSLRDYFAGEAIAAIITGNNADECTMGIGAAKDAYAVADAMLKARNSEAS